MAQLHIDDDGSVTQEYFLGFNPRSKEGEEEEREKYAEANEGRTKEKKKEEKLRKSLRTIGKLTTEFPYYSETYTDGTVCDLTNQARRTEIRFYCDYPLWNRMQEEEEERRKKEGEEEGKKTTTISKKNKNKKTAPAPTEHTAILETIMEPSSCRYTVDILTSLVCPSWQFDDFVDDQAERKRNEIVCSPIEWAEGEMDLVPEGEEERDLLWMTEASAKLSVLQANAAKRKAKPTPGSTNIKYFAEPQIKEREKNAKAEFVGRNDRRRTPPAKHPQQDDTTTTTKVTKKKQQGGKHIEQVVVEGDIPSESLAEAFAALEQMLEDATTEEITRENDGGKDDENKEEEV